MRVADHGPYGSLRKTLVDGESLLKVQLLSWFYVLKVLQLNNWLQTHIKSRIYFFPFIVNAHINGCGGDQLWLVFHRHKYSIDWLSSISESEQEFYENDLCAKYLIEQGS